MPFFLVSDTSFRWVRYSILALSFLFLFQPLARAGKNKFDPESNINSPSKRQGRANSDVNMQNTPEATPTANIDHHPSENPVDPILEYKTFSYRNIEWRFPSAIDEKVVLSILEAFEIRNLGIFESLKLDEALLLQIRGTTILRSDSEVTLSGFSLAHYLLYEMPPNIQKLFLNDFVERNWRHLLLSVDDEKRDLHHYAQYFANHRDLQIVIQLASIHNKYNKWHGMFSSIANLVRSNLNGKVLSQLNQTSKSFFKGNQSVSENLIIDFENNPLANASVQQVLEVLDQQFSKVDHGNINSVTILGYLNWTISHPAHLAANREANHEELYPVILRKVLATFLNVKKIKLTEPKYTSLHHTHGGGYIRFLQKNPTVMKLVQDSFSRVLETLSEAAHKTVPIESLDLADWLEYTVRFTNPIEDSVDGEDLPLLKSCLSTIAKFESLQSLRIYWSVRKIKDFTSLPVLPQSLRDIQLSWNYRTIVPTESVQYLGQHQNLTSIDLEKMHMNNTDLEHLSKLALRKLTLGEIWVENNNPLNSSIEEIIYRGEVRQRSLTQIMNSPFLRRVSLIGSRFGVQVADLKEFKDISNPGITSLKILNLIYKGQVEWITRFPRNFPNLEELEIGLSKYADIQFPAATIRNSKLKKIAISGRVTHLTDTLIQLLRFSELQHIDLSGIKSQMNIDDLQPFFDQIAKNDRLLIKLTFPLKSGMSASQIDEMIDSMSKKVSGFSERVAVFFE